MLRLLVFLALIIKNVEYCLIKSLVIIARKFQLQDQNTRDTLWLVSPNKWDFYKRIPHLFPPLFARNCFVQRQYFRQGEFILYSECKEEENVKYEVSAKHIELTRKSNCATMTMEERVTTGVHLLKDLQSRGEGRWNERLRASPRVP